MPAHLAARHPDPVKGKDPVRNLTGSIMLRILDDVLVTANCGETVSLTSP